MKRAVTALLATTGIALAGCSANPQTENGREEVSLTVQAAASLQTSFDEIAEEFTADHPDITLNFNYAGSSTLLQNLDAGAPADVFASADEATMDKAEAADLIEADTRQLFASNILVGIVPWDNPAEISTLQDATAPDVDLVVCAPQVPCGAVSQTVADAANITLHAVSEEQHVTDVLGKVRSGQADAGLVYATDAALAPDDVDTFEIQGAAKHPNSYPIARTSNAEHAEAADAFIEYVHSDAGQAILEEHGFAAVQD